MSDTDDRDKKKIAQLQTLITRMIADVHRFIHGYNTCSVERSHSERTVLTSKRVEYWKNWLGRCKVVQLLHNCGRQQTGELIYRALGWTVTGEVWEEIEKIDRDKTRHRQIKSCPTYNSRKKTLEYEHAARKKVVKDRVDGASKLHTYSVKKQLLYSTKETGGQSMPDQIGEDEATIPSAAVPVVRRGRPRKRKEATVTGDKENIVPLVNVDVMVSTSPLTMSEQSHCEGKRKRMIPMKERVAGQSLASSKIVIVIDAKDLYVTMY